MEQLKFWLKLSLDVARGGAVRRQDFFAVRLKGLGQLAQFFRAVGKALLDYAARVFFHG
jgi:hypothetical protein